MKKGFTLIELLAVLAIMAIAGAASIALFSSGDDITDKNELENTYIEIQNAAVVFVDLNNAWLNSFTFSNEIYVKLAEMQGTNIVSRNLINPVTKEGFPSDLLVKIFKTSLNGKEYVDTCIVYNENGHTNCIADSRGKSCECSEISPCCKN